MPIQLAIHNYRIGLIATGPPEKIQQWSAYVGAKKITRSEFDNTDIRLAVELVPGWENERRDEGIRFAAAAGGIGHVRVERPLVSGTLDNDPNGLIGTFKVNGDGPQALDGLSVFALSLLCAIQGDLLLHSSAVVRDEGAYLFLGPSGSGKTTIALELNGGGAAVSLDKTLLAPGTEHRIVACGTPFSDMERATTEAEPLPVNGLFFIEQADHHELTRLSSWEATRNLVRNSIIHSEIDEATAGSMELIADIVDLDNTYRLRFQKNEGFWPLVEKALRERPMES